MRFVFENIIRIGHESRGQAQMMDRLEWTETAHVTLVQRNKTQAMHTHATGTATHIKEAPRSKRARERTLATILLAQKKRKHCVAKSVKGLLTTIHALATLSVYVSYILRIFDHSSDIAAIGSPVHTLNPNTQAHQRQRAVPNKNNGLWSMFLCVFVRS